MRRSLRPLYQGAHFEMNFHVTPFLLKISVNNVELNIFSNSLAAAMLVDTLSETRTFGKDL